MIDYNLQNKIQEFVNYCQQKRDEYCKQHDFNLISFQVEYLTKWARVYTIQGSSRSVYAFIALSDLSNKTLGSVKAGDIHKAASWTMPAKHKRGNVFEDYADCVEPFGIKYLN